MFTFATIPLYPSLVVAWVAAGLIAAYLAWSPMKDGRFRLIGDAIAGLLGAVAGGFAAWLLVSDGTAILGSIAFAFLGAWTLVVAARTAALRRRI